MSYNDAKSYFFIISSMKVFMSLKFIFTLPSLEYPVILFIIFFSLTFIRLHLYLENVIKSVCTKQNDHCIVMVSTALYHFANYLKQDLKHHLQCE